MSAFSRRELINAATTSPWTKDFRHLQSIPRHWFRRSNIRGDAVLKSVRPADRIKWWNIVPGDQIRVLGEKDTGLREVLSINRISNRVFVRGVSDSKDPVQKPGKLNQSKNFHYSRCQLFVGNYEFPASKGSTQSRILPVFAQRIGTSKPWWNKRCFRYEWERFAVKLDPSVSYITESRISIPWPKPDKPTPAEPTSYDTLQEDVVAVTYRLPKATPGGTLPSPPSEQAYLETIFNKGTVDYDSAQFADAPLEVYLAKELSNPHSRAKKQARWQAYDLRRKALLQEFITAEVKNLNGRTERQARAEAAWKWRAQLEDDRRAQRKQRWKHKATATEVKRKNKRKARKEDKQRERLTNMVLSNEKNQFIPKSVDA
ncbi:hypothetical protein HGRIS_009267 [Hohenbuehelia grisea]|uniref:Uncharacterized protein n=1 Tax=Hohenbuehelia grisea TaxID=104357 RepID=A0ABR3J0M7_9AGAR